MELLSCPRCGESKLIEKGNNYRCEVCGATVTPKQKENLEQRLDELRKQGEFVDIGRSRTLLRTALRAQFPKPNEIINHCLDILKLIPDDFKAGFFKAFYCRKGARKEYHAFIDEHKTDKIGEYDKSVVYPFLIDQMDYEDEAAVKDFLRAQGDIATYQDRVNKALHQREIENDLFANITRDVFVSHKSDDFDRIYPFIQLLEDDGYECWYNERNLPKDTDNYKSNIEQAIKSCKIFLVFASHKAMMSKDVQWELDIAEKYKKKLRIEYRLENRENTTKFKEFFDGYQWIDGSVIGQGEALLKKVYDYSKKAKQLEDGGSIDDESEEEIEEEPKHSSAPRSAREADDADAKLRAARQAFAAGGMGFFDCYEQALVLEQENVFGAKKLKDDAKKSILKMEDAMVQERREFPRKLDVQDETQTEFANRVLAVRSAHKSHNFGPLSSKFADLFREMNEFLNRKKGNSTPSKKSSSRSSSSSYAPTTSGSSSSSYSNNTYVSPEAKRQKRSGTIILILGILMLFSPLFIVGIILVIVGVNKLRKAGSA